MQMDKLNLDKQVLWWVFFLNTKPFCYTVKVSMWNHGKVIASKSVFCGCNRMLYV